MCLLLTSVLHLSRTCFEGIVLTFFWVRIASMRLHAIPLNSNKQHTHTDICTHVRRNWPFMLFPFAHFDYSLIIQLYSPFHVGVKFWVWSLVLGISRTKSMIEYNEKITWSILPIRIYGCICLGLTICLDDSLGCRAFFGVLDPFLAREHTNIK